MKKCIKCGEKKIITDFYKRPPLNNYGNICIVCRNKQINEWHKNNPERIKKYNKDNLERRTENNRQKRKEIKDKYGLGAGTVMRFGFRIALKIYEKYERKCSICGEENDLTIHHKDKKGRNFENKGLKPNNNLSNLILVCRKCHGSIHGKEGKGIKRKTKNRKVGDQKCIKENQDK